MDSPDISRRSSSLVELWASQIAGDLHHTNEPTQAYNQCNDENQGQCIPSLLKVAWNNKDLKNFPEEDQYHPY